MILVLLLFMSFAVAGLAWLAIVNLCCGHPEERRLSLMAAAYFCSLFVIAILALVEHCK